MNHAVELFSHVPKTHNCAQSVVSGCGHDELTGEFAACGGGHAPDGLCGALYAALAIVPEEKRDAVRKEFAESAGAVTCRELKSNCHTPCLRCVELGAALVEKYTHAE